ncbi:MAG: HugZ family protein, partial [Beijerinckiaceae bacterium]
MSTEPINPIRETDNDARALAVTLMRTSRSAALATLGADGFPVSTLVAVATDMDGTPTILVSSLSAHTRNLRRDARCSLLFQQTGKGDPLAHPRITVQARAVPLVADDPVRARVRRRFLARNPKSALYADFGDFAFMRLEVEQASLNGGFGKAYELTASDVLTSLAGAEELAEIEEGAIAHMNADHGEAVRLYATRLLGEADGPWRSAAIDPAGMDFALGDRIARLAFPTTVLNGR